MKKFKETSVVELKQSTAELKKALEDICAFANQGKGTVYFGITNNGEIIGQDISDQTIQKITTTILTSIEPRVYPNIYTDIINNKTVLVVEIKNGPEKPYFYKGKAYKRMGTSNVYLSRYEIEKYLYERDNPAYRFDKSIVKDYTEKIDKKTIHWFITQAQRERNITSYNKLSSEEVLKNFGVYTDNKLNIAGILTFGKNIQQALPNAMVKCAVFEGKDKTGRILDHIELKENIFISIDRAEQFLFRNLRKSAWINPETGRREEKYEIPYIAIREAIANAVAHRDYRIQSHIEIVIYDDRVEVWSPGILPQGITLKDIHSNKAISILRNPTVSEILFLAGYIERWGTGINKMKYLMKERGLSEPEYEETASCFIVIFKKNKNEGLNEQVGTKLGLSWDQVGTKLGLSVKEIKLILKTCQTETTIKNLMDIFNWSNRTKFREKYLNPLLNNDFINMTIPDKSKSSKQRYLISEKGKELIKKIEN